MENIKICFILIRRTNAGIDLMTLRISYDVTERFATKYKL